MRVLFVTLLAAVLLVSAASAQVATPSSVPVMGLPGMNVPVPTASPSPTPTPTASPTASPTPGGPQNLYVANYGNSTITEYNPSGIQQTLTLSGATISGPYGVAVDVSGNIWVADYTGANVLEFNSSGSYVKTITPANAPTAIAVDSSGNVYIATAYHVYRYTSAGSLSLTISTSLDNPLGVAADAPGNIYVANSFNETITIYSSSGGSPTTTISTGLTSLNTVCLDTSGYVYAGGVSSGGSAVVYKFPVSGGSSVLAFTAYSSYGVQGCAINSSGNLWASVYNTSTLYEFSPSGGASTQQITTNVNHPRGIAIY